MGVPKVRFICFADWIASSRLRAKIPQEEVGKLGIEAGNDIVIYGKHLVSFSQLEGFKRKIFDICDDHFANPSLRSYYMAHSKSADMVTVNTEPMRDVVKRETGRDAIVIPDPYESDERPPGWGEGLLWFGHQPNLKQIEPYLDLNPVILTGDAWSRDKQLEALEKCAIVLIPTDNRICKSANRLIESVRNGRFVVAGELPAHQEFSEFMYIGNIKDGIEWAQHHQDECLARIRKCQAYVSERYSPAAIGRQWANVLEAVWQ